MRRVSLIGAMLAICLGPACAQVLDWTLPRSTGGTRTEGDARRPERSASGSRFYLAGASKETSAAMAARGVETMRTIYQVHFGKQGPDRKFNSLVDLNRFRTYVEANIPRSFTGIVHVNYEHDSVVSLMQSNKTPATDPRLQQRVNEFLGILALMHEIRPEARVGNWGYFQPEKWIPSWAAKTKSGVLRWDAISERDRQRIFAKWRDPALAPLWDELDVLMPHAYRAFDYRDGVSWHQPVLSSWIDATLEITTEIAQAHGGKQVVLHFNVRFSGSDYFGRAIPRDQLWETIEKCLEADVDCAAWGINSAEYYWFQNNLAKRGRFREVVTPELVAAGVSPADDDAVRAYFQRWAVDTATWIVDRMERWQAARPGSRSP